MITQFSTELSVTSKGRGLTNITGPVMAWVREQGIRNGLLTVFVRHTSASLIVQENADPDVLLDLEDFLTDLVMDGNPRYRHSLEGPDDMSAHIRSVLTQTSLSIPMLGGTPALGTWQGIYLYEHRTFGHHRTVFLHLIGE